MEDHHSITPPSTAPSEPPQSDELAIWGVFICYRQVDGKRVAEWVHGQLDGRRLDFIPDGYSDPPTLSAYFDQTSPAVDDWTRVHRPALEKSRALVFVASPGAQHRQGDEDWVHRELDWWIANRVAAPILLDPTGEGDRWLPTPIRQRWPNAQRLPVDFEEWRQLEPEERERLERRTVQRILGGIQASESSVRREEFERERERRRQLERTASALRWHLVWLIALLATAILATLAFYRAALKARSGELAALAERSLDAGDYLKGRLLAIEAVRTAKTRSGAYVLRRSLRYPRPKMIVPARGILAPVQVRISDGEFLVLSDGEVRAWDVGTGRELPRLKTEERFTSATLNPTGGTVATISESGTVRLWNTHSGTELRVVTPSASGVLFSRAENRLLTQGDTWRLWDPTSGKIIQTLGPAVDASFSADGKRLAVAGKDGKLRLFDVVSGQLKAELDQSDTAQVRRRTRILLSPDGQGLLVWKAGDSETSIRLLDSKSGKQIFVDEGIELHGIPSFSADSQYVVFVGGSEVRIWSIQKPNRPKTVEVAREREYIDEAGFDHRGGPWTFNHTLGRLTIWNGFEPEESLRFDFRSDLGPGAYDQFELRLTRRANRLAIVCWKTELALRDGAWVKQVAEMLLWDLGAGEESERFDDPANPIVRAWFVADGRQVLTRSALGSTRLWSTTAGGSQIVDRFPPEVRTFPSSDLSVALVVKPGDPPRLEDLVSEEPVATLSEAGEEIQDAWPCDGGRRLVIATASGTTLWNPASQKELATLSDADNSVNVARFDPDCRRLATFDDYGEGGKLWDAGSGSLLGSFASRRVSDATFSRDGRLLASASVSDSYLRIRDGATGRELRKLLDPSTGTTWGHVSFSSDTRRIVATGHLGNLALVWDAVSGEPVLRLLGHSDRVRSAAFSADDQWIVTASQDRTARIWDASSGEEIAVLHHDSPVRQAICSADRRKVLTVAGGSAFIFDTSIEEVLALAESRLPVNLSAEDRRRFMGR